MSPEQLQGRMIDMRSDLYSFGATMYFMLTGKLPFSDKNPTRFAYQLLNASPTPPSELNPKVPKKLDVAILGLLRKNPNERVQSSSEIFRMLSEIDLANPETANQTLFIGNAPMIGRDSELSYLGQLWNSASHSCTTVVISGTFGIGKSRLVDEFSSSIQLQAETLLRARGVGQTGSLPLEGLKQLLFNFMHYDLQIDGLPDEVFNAVANIEPGCAKSLGYSKPITTVSIREMTTSFVRLVSRLSQKKPIAIVVEETPNIDEISLLACLDLASDPANKIFLILTTDRAPIKNSSSFENAYVNVRNKSYIQLEPLGMDSIKHFLVHIFQNNNYPIELQHDLMEKYSGNPYLMISHLKKLVKDGNLLYVKGKILYKKSITTGSHVFFSEILSNLSNSARQVLNLFALAAIPLDSQLIFDVLNLHKDTVQSALDELKASSLIKDANPDELEKYSISYPILIPRIENLLDADEKKRLHESIARKLEVLSVDSPNLIEQTTKHYILSGNFGKSIEWSKKCALYFLKAGLANEDVYVGFIDSQAKKLDDPSLKNISNYLRAVQLFSKGEISRSESLFTKVIKTSPELNDYETYFDAIIDLFSVYKRQEKLESYLQFAEEAVQKHELTLFPEKYYELLVLLSVSSIRIENQSDSVRWVKIALDFRKSRNMVKVTAKDIMLFMNLLGCLQIQDANEFSKEILKLLALLQDAELYSVVSIMMAYSQYLLGNAHNIMSFITQHLNKIESLENISLKILCLSFAFAVARHCGDFEFIEKFKADFFSIIKTHHHEPSSVHGQASLFLTALQKHGWKDVYLGVSAFYVQNESGDIYSRTYTNLLFGVIVWYQDRVRDACNLLAKAWQYAISSGSDVIINYCGQTILSLLIPGRKYPLLDPVLTYFTSANIKTSDYYVNNLYLAYAKGLALFLKSGKKMAEFEHMLKLLHQAQEMAIGNEMKTLYASICLSLGYAYDQKCHSKYATADDGQKAQNLLFTAEFIYNAIGADYMASIVQKANSGFVFE
jgi:hypothetical protein